MMFKVKEFERTSTQVEEDVNEFIKENNIKDFEVCGYQVDWSESYEDHCSHILIKYWEEQ
ncbi:hypothetical protein [Staphylococcus pasteuri]|uniref:hypothetical protein n=1 Tax=Staphylococcus pasteuri TaxID=45972 RepID=UPI000F837E9F|nr:hypothetical protein [Staphylococcus pasteuri]MEB6612105.1 hypothetical protein [Staphylococcus pasteuri]QQN55260.1 hypothetical protein I6I26_09710 [Staphylococcus pasteuri]RTX74141.1 hypothetical protein CD121_05455 [Staphylococcus pasteuri]